MRHADRDRHLKIMVAALTRRRPDMLKSLLASLAACDLPDQAEVLFLVVENDDTPRSKEVVRRATENSRDRRFQFLHEQEIGIPFARNRAAREAIAQGADLLAFVDDDEVVAADWLVQIVRAYRQSTAVLIGGPIRVQNQMHGLSQLQRALLHGLARRLRKKERRAARLAGLHGTPRVTIVTNNWLGEISIFKTHDIWFDEEMRFSGGTDAKLYADVVSKGLATAWAADAVVYEGVPPERLSICYQFGRARDQAMAHATRKPSRWRSTLVDLCLLIPARLLVFVFLALSVPLTAGRTLLTAVRTSGWIVGRTMALFGGRSTHYASVTGK